MDVKTYCKENCIDISMFTDRAYHYMEASEEICGVIKQLHNAGFSSTDLSRALNIGTNFVLKSIKAETYDFVEGTTADLGKMMALYNAKWNLEDIASEIGASVETTRTLLKEELKKRGK